jgi:hypothetical protein
MKRLSSKSQRSRASLHARVSRTLTTAGITIAVTCTGTVCVAETPAVDPLPLAWYCAGDADYSGQEDLTDVLYLVNFVFKGGPPPESYYLQGDATCDGWVDARDIVALVSYWFRERSLCDFCASVFPDSALLLEAQVMAMWYAEALEPPLGLTKRFQSDLRFIRTVLIQDDPALDGIFFTVPWGQLSFIYLGLDSATAHQVADSSYHAWDLLNLRTGLDSVREFAWIPNVMCLYFAGVKNPDVLAAAYKDLPGALWAEAKGRGGDPTTNVVPIAQNDTVAYLFMQRWGDCPSGCTHARYYYVRGTRDSLWYVGRWPTGSNASEPKPSWWPSICEHLQLVEPYTPCE